MARSEFVGRHREVAQITARLRLARSGTAQVVLVAGEPGIGKTSLARRIDAIAAADGMRTAWGRASPDEGSPPYWPFRLVLRDLALQSPVAAAAEPALAFQEFADAGSGGSELGAEERFRLTDALAGDLAAAATGSGLLVVLDDLQWADASTLRLLPHLVRSAPSTRLMILGTYRDTEIQGRHALAGALATLGGEESCTRIRLVGFSTAEVSAQLAALAGAGSGSGAGSDISPDISEDIVATVSRRTQGNPFFVAELGRLLTSGSPTGLPDAVRTAVRARLGALSPAGRLVVSVAALLGLDIDPGVLVAAAQRALPEVLTALDEAVEAGLVVRVDTTTWRLHHDLVRESARLDVPTATQLEVHGRVATYLESRGDAGQRCAEIAYHWIAALPAGDEQRAAKWAELAGDSAAAQLASEIAAEKYHQALRAWPGMPASDRSRILVKAAVAHKHALDLGAAQDAVRLAAEAARTAGDPVGLARAALALEGVTDANWSTSANALCDEALTLLPPGDSALRSRLLAQRTSDSAFVHDPDADERSAAALAMAQRLGDDAALRSALRARQIAMAGPAGVHERLELGSRQTALGEREGSDDAVLWGRLWRFNALCQLGRLDEAEAEVGAIGEAARKLRSRMASWHHLRTRSTLASARGRFEAAREHAREGLDLARRSDNETLFVLSSWQLALIAERTGLMAGDPAVSVLTSSARRHTVVIGAAWLADLGRLEEARRLYRPEQLDEAIPGMLLLPALAGFARAAARLGDRQAAARAYSRLLRHGELMVCGGAGVIAIDGPAHTPLGIAAAALGRSDDAVRHLRRAVTLSDGAGMPPAAGVARCELARLLAARRRPGDENEAEALATAAAATGTALGMAPLLSNAQAVLASLSGASPSGLSKREREVAQLVGQGLTNRQIGAVLHIAERTAENHVQHILAKLGFATRSQIAAWTARGGSGNDADPASGREIAR